MTSVANQPDRGPRAVERQICAVSPATTVEALCAAIDAADWLLTRAKSIHHLSRQIAINWIENNGEFSIGDMHFRVDYPMTVRCTDPRACGHELLKVLAGDFDSYLQMLVAQPYKHGSVSKVLSTPIYRSFFATKSAARLINGVPERTLKRVDTRFAVAQTK
jgi:hypothetical protein